MSPVFRLSVALLFVLSVVTLTSWTRAEDRPPTSRPTTQMVKIDDQMAYAVGAAVGRRLVGRIQEDGLVVNVDQIVKGMADALGGKQPPCSQEELDALIFKVEEAVATRWARQAMATNPSFRKMATENLKDSRIALDVLSKIEGVETLKNGVLVKVLKEGEGPYIASARILTANFKVALADMTLIKATEPGKPVKVPSSRILPALREVLHGMRVGSLCRVALPADLAYGLAGKPPVIGPNQALLFEIEVLAAETTAGGASAEVRP